MSIEVKREKENLHISVHMTRIDGDNAILESLKKHGHILPDIRLVEIDLSEVSYLNSLGITEFVTIHRAFFDVTSGKAKIRFTHVDRKVQAILELVELHKISEIVPRS